MSTRRKACTKKRLYCHVLLGVIWFLGSNVTDKPLDCCRHGLSGQSVLIQQTDVQTHLHTVDTSNQSLHRICWWFYFEPCSPSKEMQSQTSIMDRNNFQCELLHLTATNLFKWHRTNVFFSSRHILNLLTESDKIQIRTHGHTRVVRKLKNEFN